MDDQQAIERYRYMLRTAAHSSVISYTIRYTGTKCDGPAGEWVIESSGLWSGGGGSAQIGGPIYVQIERETLTGTMTGTAQYRNSTDTSQEDTDSPFGGTARFVAEPAALELIVTSYDQARYLPGFTRDFSAMQPGPLTFPLQIGDFCDN